MRIQWVIFLLLCLFAVSTNIRSANGQSDEDIFGDRGAANAGGGDPIFGGPGDGDGGAEGAGDGEQASPEEVAAQAEADMNRLNQEAAARKAQGDLNGALDLYEEAAAVKPNLNSYLEIARILAEQEDYQTAISYYRGATQFAQTLEDPVELVPVFSELGQVYLDTEQFNEALNLYRQAMTIPKQGRNPELLFKSGVAITEYALNQPYATNQTRQEQLQEGLGYFDKAIRIRPDYAEALYERGNTYVLLGEVDKALDDLSLSVSTDPTDTDAVAQLGFVSLQRGLGEAAKRNGVTARILFDLNRSVDQLTNWLNTVPEDAEIDEEDPDAVRRETVLLNRSAALIALADEQGNADNLYRRAVDDANAAIELEPEKPDAYFQKGIALRMIGDFDGAIDALTESIENSPGNSEGHLRRGIIRYRQNEFELAKADFEKAVQYTARGLNPRAHFWLGLCYQNKGEIHRAVVSYTRALRIRPRYVDAHMNRGLAYMREGRYRQAAKDFADVLLIDRNHSQAKSLQRQAQGRASAG